MEVVDLVNINNYNNSIGKKHLDVNQNQKRKT